MVEMLGAYFESISLRRYLARNSLLERWLYANVLDIGRAVPFDRSGKVLGSF